MIGTKLGKYEILEEIGKGGMAVVYRGFDTELERDVAVKVLHDHLSAQPESKRRFHREARAVARLRAPNIVEIFDYSGKESEKAFIVTEVIHGPTLKDFVDKHPDLPVEAAALIALEVCRGLHHAHENQIIHRDIKPENIMIQSDGVVKIMDFGIAQVAGTTQMTITGQILGSPAYMSPEHVENKPLDFRADIFSLGTLLYWLTTGRLPFEGRNPHAVIKRIVDGEYADPVRLRPVVGERMARIIRRCLEVDPANRYPLVDELIVDLKAFLEDLGIRSTARELKRFFEDPGGYADHHREVLLPVLIRRGKEARRRRDMTAAIDYFNRVLALDETNEEVLELVERMTAGTRARRIIEVVAVAAAVAVAFIAVAWGLFRVGQQGDEPVEVIAELDPISVGADAGTDHPTDDGGAAPAATDASPEADGGASSDAAGPRRLIFRPPAITIARLRKVRIVPDPPAARITVDGRQLGEYGSRLAQGIDLSVGRHEVLLEPRDSWYAPLEFQLNVPAAAPDSGLLAVTRTLPFRPAFVRINTPAPGAMVFIPHRERARANQLFRVRMNAREERLQMIVAAEGFESEVLDVVLRAGEEFSREVNLAPTAPAKGIATRSPPAPLPAPTSGPAP